MAEKTFKTTENTRVKKDSDYVIDNIVPEYIYNILHMTGTTITKTDKITGVTQGKFKAATDKIGVEIKANVPSLKELKTNFQIYEAGQISDVPDFWAVDLGKSLKEEDYPPVVPLNGYWYCTKNNTTGGKSYTKGVIYRATNVKVDANNKPIEVLTWEATDFTKKDVISSRNLMKNVKQFTNQEAEDQTDSNSLIKYELKGEGYTSIDSHIFTVTNQIQYKEDQPFVTLSLKMKSNIESGCAYVVLAFSDKRIEEITERTVVAVYEPSVLITPDEYKNYDNLVITVPNLKKGTVEEGGSFHECVASFAPPDIPVGKKWLQIELNTKPAKPVYKSGKLFQKTQSGWAQITDKKSCYIVDALLNPLNGAVLFKPKTIFTYRELFQSFYPSDSYYTDNFSIKNIYGVVTFYGGQNLITDSLVNDYIPVEKIPAVPTIEYRNKYWAKANDYVYRAELEYSSNGVPVKGKAWVSTQVKTSEVIKHPLATDFISINRPYMVPPKGDFNIGDLKIEYSSRRTRWVPHVNELYAKNIKLDENGIQVTSGQNKMLIDEDEVTSYFIPDTEAKKQEIFKVKGDETFFNRIDIKEEMKLKDFTFQETDFEETKVLVVI